MSLSWLTNSALMSPNAGAGRGVAGSQPMSTVVHRSPNKLWRSNSIFNWNLESKTFDTDPECTRVPETYHSCSDPILNRKN
jgi:hypothetical protein